MCLRVRRDDFRNLQALHSTLEPKPEVLNPAEVESLERQMRPITAELRAELGVRGPNPKAPCTFAYCLEVE